MDDLDEKLVVLAKLVGGDHKDYCELAFEYQALSENISSAKLLANRLIAKHSK